MVRAVTIVDGLVIKKTRKVELFILIVLAVVFSIEPNTSVRDHNYDLNNTKPDKNLQSWGISDPNNARNVTCMSAVTVVSRK